MLRSRLHPQNVPFLVEKTAYVKTQIKCTSTNVPVQILYILNLPRPQLAASRNSYENGPESPALSKAGMNVRSFRAGWVEGKYHSSFVLCSPQDEERSSSFIVTRLRRNSLKSEHRIRYPPLRPNFIARSCFSQIHFRTVRRRVTGRSLPNWNSCVDMRKCRKTRGTGSNPASF